MADSLLVEHLEPFQDLLGDLAGVRSRLVGVLLHVLAEISVLDVLHREEYVVLVLVPAEELYEQVAVLQDNVFVSQSENQAVWYEYVHLSR